MDLQEISIAKHLTSNPQIQARQLKIANDHGQLVIEGKVDSYFAKQMAQESIREFEGVETIENRLQVTAV